MRDIEKYGEDYKTKNNFEAVQVSYRRKKVLECLNNVTPPPTIISHGVRLGSAFFVVLKCYEICNCRAVFFVF